MNQAVILDISSDDEVGFDDSLPADNFDWISNFFEDVPSGDGVVNFASNVGDDDSDDVVVVGEVLPKSKRAKTSVPRYRNEGFDEDDDCVVLNCDPDKPTDGHDKGSDGDSDDLCIVGEKGQVACRDYPHSRHLCAKFPFGSTQHESHCDLCHCYVCDSLAPCAYWGSGVSGLDHCSATDKVEYWQLERKKIRQLKNPTPPIIKPAAEPLSRLPQLQETSARPTLGPRATSAYGLSSTFRLQSVINHKRNQRPSITIPRNKVQPHQVSRQLLRPCNGPIRSHRNSSSAPCMASSRSLLKRSGFTGRVGVVNRSAYIPPNVSGSYWQQLLNCPSVGKPAESNSINLTESSAHLDVNISSSQPLTSCVLTGTLPSLLQVYNDPVAQTPTSNFQGYDKSTVVTSDIPWVYSSGSQAQNDPTSFIQSDIASNALNNVTPSCQQSSGGIQNISGSNFPCNTSGVLSNITPRIHQPSEAIQNFTDSDFPYNTINSMNGIAQSHQQRSAENPLVQDVVPRPGYLPSVEQNLQIPGGMDSSSLDFDIDGWLWDNDPLLGVQNGSNLFNMNNQPSVPASVDAGMLYSDFETACRGLAHS